MALDDSIIKNTASSNDTSILEQLFKNACVSTQPPYQFGSLAAPRNNSEDREVLKDAKVTEEKKSDI